MAGRRPSSTEMPKRLFTILVLVSLGTLLVALGSVRFESRKELFRVADFRATFPVQKSYPVLRYVGFVCLVGGVVLLIRDVKNGR